MHEKRPFSAFAWGLKKLLAKGIHKTRKYLGLGVSDLSCCSANNTVCLKIFQIIIDDSSSANESSSEKPKDFKKSKRPPPPQIKSSPSKGTETEVKKVPEISTENPEINDNNNLLGLVNCAVCGKQFGKNSIKFHLRQCQKKQQLIKGRQEKIEESAKQQTEEDEGTF